MIKNAVNELTANGKGVQDFNEDTLVKSGLLPTSYISGNQIITPFGGTVSIQVGTGEQVAIDELEYYSGDKSHLFTKDSSLVVLTLRNTPRAICSRLKGGMLDGNFPITMGNSYSGDCIGPRLWATYNDMQLVAPLDIKINTK